MELASRRVTDENSPSSFAASTCTVTSSTLNRRHLLLLGSTADIYFTIQQHVEGQYILGTAVRMCNQLPRLCVFHDIHIQLPTIGSDYIAVRRMLLLDHCNLQTIEIRTTLEHLHQHILFTAASHDLPKQHLQRCKIR